MNSPYPAHCSLARAPWNRSLEFKRRWESRKVASFAHGLNCFRIFFRSCSGNSSSSFDRVDETHCTAGNSIPLLSKGIGTFSTPKPFAHRLGNYSDVVVVVVVVGGIRPSVATLHRSTIHPVQSRGQTMNNGNEKLLFIKISPDMERSGYVAGLAHFPGKSSSRLSEMRHLMQLFLMIGNNR